MIRQYTVLHWSRQVEWTASEGSTRYWMYRDDCGADLDSRLDGDTRQFRLAADSRPHPDLCANVYLDSPYYKGHSKVMCVSSPVYPLIIGNVRGARQMLPDPDWKAKDQRSGAPDRTSVATTIMTMTTKLLLCLVGCSKRIPTERKLRIETRRRSQSSSRMITVLHKMSKSKRAPQRESVLLDQS